MSASALFQPLEWALSGLDAQNRLAVALSGGPDSSALAVCADAWCRQNNQPLLLLHVHHGLQAQADVWQAQVKALADLLDRPLAVQRVQVDLASGLGLEAAARQARYQALCEMARRHEIKVILLAHHQQDQAETVLMRLLRGSGVSGLAGMAPVSERYRIVWLRPWLDVRREQVLEYLGEFSKRTGWLPVDDPSNLDADFARGVIRTTLVPAIEQHWPSWRESLARHAKQAAQADRLLTAYGQLLLKRVGADGSDSLPKGPASLSLAKWRELSDDEQVLVLRVWFRGAGVHMPTEKRLTELLRQLRQVHALGHDRSLQWQQSDCVVSCIRGQLYLQVKMSNSAGTSQQ